MNTNMMILSMNRNLIFQNCGEQAESITLEIIEPHWDNNKSYLHLRKEKKVTFEDNMPNMKTDINHNVLTQTSENSNQMEYYEQTEEMIVIVIEYLTNNKMEICARFE